MLIASDTGDLRSALAAARRQGARIGLVPTMGNLHEGHLRLIREMKSTADYVVASLFVNPLQFDRAEDLAAYPRTLTRDSELLEQEKVDLLFTPTPHSIYPRGLASSSFVEVPGLSDTLCGADRPGHFRGVATIVTILLNLVRPDTAIFGEKDFQQLLIIRRLVQDLALDVQILTGATVREADGLAMSSRNAYLSPDERKRASSLFGVLNALADRIKCGDGAMSLLEAEAEKRLLDAGFTPDYVAIRRACDLMLPGPKDRELRVLAAAFLGKARLIDNIPVTIGE